MYQSPFAMKAATFCVAAHSAVGQVRKYTGEPYHTHPFAVADILIRLNDLQITEQMIAAAYLHDVVEDTQVPLSVIQAEFGSNVAVLVDELTDKFSDSSHGNRATRKAMECKRLSTISEAAQTIKYADLIHNSESIFRADPGFAAVYLEEKKAILQSMCIGHPALYSRAWSIIEKHEAL